MKKKDWKFKKGIASLPIVFAFIVLILAVAVGMTAVSFSESFTTAGEKESGKALLYSEAGARDALIRMARNKNYTCSSADCYQIDFVTNGCTNSDGCAKISVSAGDGSSGNPKIITSKGLSKSSVRTVSVSVQYDTNLEGQFNTITWSEVSE